MPTTVGSIIVLNDFCYVQGGASKVAIDEAVALRAAGFDVTMLAAVGTPSQALQDAGVRVVSLGQPELLHAIRHPTAAWRSAWNALAFSEMRKLLARCEQRRTVVHLHGYTKALSPSPMLATRVAGVAAICTLHDFFAACPNGAFFDYRRRQPCERRALSVSCMLTNCDKRHMLHKGYRVMRGLAQRHYARFPASVENFITLSRRSAEILQPYLPPEARLYPLPNIIDASHLPPVTVAANRPLVVLGRLDAEKGVMLAAEAARQASVPIVFVGDGPLRPALESMGATVTGWQETAAVQQWLGAARCLVFPSLWYEAFGLVVEEAAARGVPAIVSDVCAASERVRHGITGWIVPSGDVGALAHCMHLTQDDACVAAAGVAAYEQFWRDPPDRQRHVQGLVAIYEDVLARGCVAGKAQDMLAN